MGTPVTDEKTFTEKTNAYTENFKAANDTVSRAAKKSIEVSPGNQTEKPLTLSQLARELEREGAALEEQRATVAATEARIAEKQKAMRTMTDGIGKRK